MSAARRHVPVRVGGALAFVLAAALLVACGGGNGDMNEPPPASALAAEPLLPEGCLERGGYCGMLTPGGMLTAAAWLDDHRMYLTDLEGRIRLLNVRTGELRTVKTGLSMPQGVTVLRDRLYVTDLGNVCQGIRDEAERLEAARFRVLPWCKILMSRRPNDVLLEHLAQYTARIFSYRIDETGNLDTEQVIVDRIVVIGRDHSPNGLTNDGNYVYVSIGYPHRYFGDHVDQLEDMSVRHDLMGVIARIDPSGSVEIYARGLRNVYGISIAPDGTIYGADNDVGDGIAESGHLEELNAIREGEFYGFPMYGTNEAPPDANVTEPVAILQGVASTATHANEDGVYVAYLHIEEDARRVVERFDYETFNPTVVYSENTLTTAILERNGLLYLVTLDGEIHVIDPNAAPVPFGMRLSIAEIDRILASEPVIRSRYDVYLDDSRLIYIKESCEEEEEPFFLHISPDRVDDLPEERKEDGFENFDFDFDRYGWTESSMCIALRFLPSYNIAHLATGQHIVGEVDGQETFEPVWTGRLYFPVHALFAEGLDRILASDPVIRSEYNIYLDDSRLIYIKESCTEEAKSFSLHIYPVRTEDLPPERREHGFENLDFAFDRYGEIRDDTCVALRYLPAYDIEYLTTGQYILGERDGETTFETVWRERLSFPD